MQRITYSQLTHWEALMQTLILMLDRIFHLEAISEFGHMFGSVIHGIERLQVVPLSSQIVIRELQLRMLDTWFRNT